MTATAVRAAAPSGLDADGDQVTIRLSDDTAGRRARRRPLAAARRAAGRRPASSSSTCAGCSSCPARRWPASCGRTAPAVPAAAPSSCAAPNRRTAGPAAPHRPLARHADGDAPQDRCLTAPPTGGDVTTDFLAPVTGDRSLSERVDRRTGLIRASGHLTPQGADLLQRDGGVAARERAHARGHRPARRPRRRRRRAGHPARAGRGAGGARRRTRRPALARHRLTRGGHAESPVPTGGTGLRRAQGSGGSGGAADHPAHEPDAEGATRDQDQGEPGAVAEGRQRRRRGALGRRAHRRSSPGCSRRAPSAGWRTCRPG